MRFPQDFESFTEEHGGIEHEIWVGGEGPPILLMHELDGFTDAAIALIERMAAHFRVFAPVFFGKVGQREGMLSAARGMVQICVQREFYAFRMGKTSPIVEWVRALLDRIHARDDTVGSIGLIGMCLTGGIVLATIAEPSVAAGVAAQPALPMAFPYLSTKARKRDLGMCKEDVEAAAHSGKPILTLRFEFDKICPAKRIPSILAQIPSAVAPPEFLRCSRDHPTLTARYRKESTQEDIERSEQAIEITIAFLKEHLQSEQSTS